MSGYLPCGVTDAMCEPDDPPCGSCGHLWSDHYEADEAENVRNNNLRMTRNGNEHHNQIEYDSQGFIVHACDCTNGGKTQEERKLWQCDCEGFSDDEPEPDYNPEDYDD